MFEVHCSNVDVREGRNLLLNYHPGVLSVLKSTTRVEEEEDRRAQQSNMKPSNAGFSTRCHSPDHHYVGRYALDRNSLIWCSIYLHDALCGNG